MGGTGDEGRKFENDGTQWESTIYSMRSHLWFLSQSPEQLLKILVPRPYWAQAGV